MKMSKLGSRKRIILQKEDKDKAGVLTLSERVSTCHFLKGPATLQKHIRPDTHIDACNPEIDNDGYLDANNENKILLHNEGIYLFLKERNAAMYYSFIS